MNTASLKWSKDIHYSESNSALIPENGGVYKVLRDDGKVSKYSRVYVGKAKDLRKRYLEHLSVFEQNACLKRNLNNGNCYFRYTLVSLESDREELESQLLEDGYYECNKNGQ
jgi:excinuclease UvrABC nuclease subunit